MRLKSDLGLRPNRHQTEDHADAHVVITVLAYQLLSFIRDTLGRAGDHRSWPTLRRILQPHQYATVVLPTRTGTTYMVRKPGEPEQCDRQIYGHVDVGLPSLPQRVVETQRKRQETFVVTYGSSRCTATTYSPSCETGARDRLVAGATGERDRLMSACAMGRARCRAECRLPPHHGDAGRRRLAAPLSCQILSAADESTCSATPSTIPFTCSR